MPKNDAVYANFGALLRGCRSRSGLTQAELAEKVKISRTSVTNIECGRQQVVLHQLLDFADALGVEPSELIPETNSNVPVDLIDRLAQGKGASATRWAEQILKGK